MQDTYGLCLILYISTNHLSIYILILYYFQIVKNHSAYLHIKICCRPNLTHKPQFADPWSTVTVSKLIEGFNIKLNDKLSMFSKRLSTPPHPSSPDMTVKVSKIRPIFSMLLGICSPLCQPKPIIFPPLGLIDLCCLLPDYYASSRECDKSM